MLKLLLHMKVMKQDYKLDYILTVYVPRPSVDSAFQKSTVTKGIAEVIRS